MDHLRNQYANIFFVGENGGFRNIDELINQIKTMILYSGSNRYVVISFHKPNNVIKTIPQMKEMEDSLATAFGRHFINLRESFVNCGLKIAGVEPTQEDLDSLKNGQVPPQLLSDGIHFTDKGYHVIAQLVYDKIKELNY